jgi:glucokinase
VRIFGRAEYEQVISGLGLANLARFTHRGKDCADIRGVDPATLPAAVTGAAMNGRCACCEDALNIFLSVYGAEAGNLALHSLATAGVYVGGGIAPKILPALEDGRFMNAFRAKGSMAQLMATIPVSVILNRQCGLLGAAVHANSSA